MATKLETRLNNLAAGYVRTEFQAYESYDNFEESLIKLMVRFLGNILMIFDVYPLECKALFSDDGLVII